jgi:hypothetical protein
LTAVTGIDFYRVTLHRSDLDNSLTYVYTVGLQAGEYVNLHHFAQWHQPIKGDFGGVIGVANDHLGVDLQVFLEFLNLVGAIFEIDQ